MVPMKFSVVTEKTVSIWCFKSFFFHAGANWNILDFVGIPWLTIYNWLQVFATPEASIGFHTDCGFSYMHSRLPGRLGKKSQNKGSLFQTFQVLCQENMSKSCLAECDIYQSIVYSLSKQHNQINSKIEMACMFCISLKWRILWLTFAGEFLALTGARLNGKELVAAGLATHFVPSEVRFALLCIWYRFRLSHNDNRL